MLRDKLRVELLSGSDRGMSKEQLDRAEVGASGEQARGERVAEPMRMDAEPDQFGQFAHPAPDGLGHPEVSCGDCLCHVRRHSDPYSGIALLSAEYQAAANEILRSKLAEIAYAHAGPEQYGHHAGHPAPIRLVLEPCGCRVARSYFLGGERFDLMHGDARRRDVAHGGLGKQAALDAPAEERLERNLISAGRSWADLAAAFERLNRAGVKAGEIAASILRDEQAQAEFVGGDGSRPEAPLDIGEKLTAGVVEADRMTAGEPMQQGVDAGGGGGGIVGVQGFASADSGDVTVCPNGAAAERVGLPFVAMRAVRNVAAVRGKVVRLVRVFVHGAASLSKQVGARVLPEPAVTSCSQWFESFRKRK